VEKRIFLSLAFLPLLLLACSRLGGEISSYPLDGISGVISRGNVAIDEDIKAQGEGSLRISATVPTVVSLFETGDIDVEGAKLVYKAMIRTGEVKGRVYLEMLMDRPEGGQLFARGIDAALTGTNDWKAQSISFALKEGQNPKNVRLNVVIDGTGTVWVDDVKLVRKGL